MLNQLLHNNLRNPNGWAMTNDEIRIWNANLNLLENAQKLQVSILDLGKEPVSFYEALAIYLAEAYSKSQTSEFSSYGYPSLAAA